MEKLFSKIKKETLNPDEKIKILSDLKNFVAENPIQNIRSPFYSSWSVMRHKAFIIPIVSLAFVFILINSSFLLSKNSLPGDTLYPVKMLNEQVQSLSTLDAKSKAQVEASHAILRLQEIEQLVSSNAQLNVGTGQKIGTNFGLQLQDMTHNINQLQNNGQKKEAGTIWSDFKKSVDEHEKIITNLSSTTSNSTDTQNETRTELIKAVSDIHLQIEKTSQETENHNDEIKTTNTIIPTTNTIKTETENKRTRTTTQTEIRNPETRTASTTTQTAETHKTDSSESESD